MSTPEHAVSTVLMVDDNATNLQVLFKTLQPSGHRLLAAKSGEEAVKTATQTTPDLILLDIMMPPGMDGYETLKRLKSEAALTDVPVIFLSSLDATESKVKGLELGAVDYISKPFEAAEVTARVDTHLKLRRLQAELTQRNEQLAQANNRMKSDLEAAGRVQQALLPRSLPDCDGYDFGWAYRPCDELGGDALDIFKIDDDTVGFYLLDVSGHGVPASLLAVTATRSLQPRPDRSSIVLEAGWDPGSAKVVPPGEVIRRLNVMNPMDDDRNPHFITMIYGLLQLSTGTIRYACAGHPGPIVVPSDGAPRIVDGGSPPVGLMPDADFEELELRLKPGDRIYIHSDGLNEQRDGRGQELGRERLRDALASVGDGAMTSADLAIGRVDSWSGAEEIGDDLSIVALFRATR